MILSFSEDENIGYQQAYYIAQAIAKYYSQHYQIFFVVHEDHNAPPIHFVMNTLDYDGRKYDGTKADYYLSKAHKSCSETLQVISTGRKIYCQRHLKVQFEMIRHYLIDFDIWYETPLDWLKAAGIINKCINVTQDKIPLSVNADNDSFKVYMIDTGLLCSKFDIAANIVINSTPSFDGFKGALTENYIMQVLAVNGFTPYYWDSLGKAELDFPFQNRQGNIIPLEAKSATNVKAESLMKYIDTYKPPYAIRVPQRTSALKTA